MSKAKLTKCFPCFCGHPCGGGKRLSRKKKKKLKEFFIIVKPYTQLDLFEHLSSCNLGDQYRTYSKELHLTPFVKKNKRAIELILMNCDEVAVGAVRDNKFKFEFTWEYDNGLYVEEGSMPLIFLKNDFNKTWAGEETESLFKRLRIPFESITNDKDLIKYVSKNYNSIIKESDELEIGEFEHV